MRLFSNFFFFDICSLESCIQKQRSKQRCEDLKAVELSSLGSVQEHAGWIAVPSLPLPHLKACPSFASSLQLIENCPFCLGGQANSYNAGRVQSMWDSEQGSERSRCRRMWLLKVESQGSLRCCIPWKFLLCTKVKTWTKTCVFLQAAEWILTMEKLHHPLKSTTQLRPIAELGGWALSYFTLSLWRKCPEPLTAPSWIGNGPPTYLISGNHPGYVFLFTVLLEKTWWILGRK